MNRLASAPSCSAFTHRVAFEEGSGPRALGNFCCLDRGRSRRSPYPSVPGFGSVVGTGGLSQGKVIFPGKGAKIGERKKGNGKGAGRGPGRKNWCRE